MNLLYIHETLGSLGGAEANVFITATEFKKRGHRIGLVTRRSSEKNTDRWEELFDDIYFQADVSIGDILDRFQPHVLYLHKWDHLPTLREWVECDVPMARMVHDHDSYCLRSYRYNPLTRAVCRRPASWYCVFPCLATVQRNRDGGLPIKVASYFDKLKELDLCRRMDAQFVVTRYMREELLTNHFSAERIHIFPPVPREVEPLTSSFSDRNLIVFAGQIIRGKGVDILLKALARMKEPFECIILGHGNHQPACEALCQKLGLSDRVSFPGFIPQEQLRNYYREASAVVVPSVWPEPIATIGLEVMRYGLPVVAFDAGGISDWLTDGDNGFLVPWMDEAKFASSLDSLMRDKELAQRMGESGRTRVQRDYAFDDYIERLEDTLQRLGNRETLTSGEAKAT